MQIFESLEEKNLFLIQQGQENQKQYEEKNREYNAVKSKAEHEFNNLETREREMQNRIDKTYREFATLQAETLDDNTKIIKPEKYKLIWEKAKKILSMFFGNKEVKQSPPVQMLLEIEHKIEAADAYIAQQQMRNEDEFADTLKNVKKVIKAEKAEEDTKKKKEEDER